MQSVWVSAGSDSWFFFPDFLWLEGPNEVSFADPDVINPLLGSHGVAKGPCQRRSLYYVVAHNSFFIYRFPYSLDVKSTERVHAISCSIVRHERACSSPKAVESCFHSYCAKRIRNHDCEARNGAGRTARERENC